jgi:hypothetical protein
MQALWCLDFFRALRESNHNSSHGGQKVCLLACGPGSSFAFNRIVSRTKEQSLFVLDSERIAHVFLRMRQLLGVQKFHFRQKHASLQSRALMIESLHPLMV